MDIAQILQHINDYEEEISSYDLSLSAIQTLLSLYQKAIEYYSAIDDLEGTTEFLQRNRELM
jgi:prefoldin subunit 5